MIKNYYEVTILWGGSGRKCARLLADELTKRHYEDYMPINSFIFEKEALESNSIMDEVIKKIKHSSACIVVLTFDDVDNTRVRQNILIETGIAWTLLGKDNLMFLSDKSVIPEDFPSNIRTNINTNYFDKSDLESTIQNVCNELIKTHNIHSTKNLLSLSDYVYDGRILDDLDANFNEGKADVQLKKIIIKWKDAVERFDYLHERIMYVIERIAFLPIFGSDSEIVSFMKSIKDEIVPTDRDRMHSGDGEISRELQNVMNMTNQVIEYTLLKNQEKTNRCLNNPLENKRDTEMVERNFRRIFNELEVFISGFEKGVFSYNWLIKIVAYDYAALTKMKMYVIDSKPCSAENRGDLEDAINYFEKAKNLAQKYDVASENIWLGYIQYNLARAYKDKYDFTKDESLLMRIKDNLLDAIGYREGWLASEYYKGLFSTALSYEFFIASYYDYLLRNSLEGYSTETPEENLDNIISLRNMLTNYCDKSELGTLYRIRDKIDDLIAEIRG